MSQPLKLRNSEAFDFDSAPPQLNVLPPPLPVSESELKQSPAASLHRESFLSPEEIDIEAGFRAQEAIDSALESPWKGCAGGALAALVCTLAAGGTAALTGYWYGFFSIGIGFVVAFGVRKLGRGNNTQFGIIGAKAFSV